MSSRSFREPRSAKRRVLYLTPYPPTRSGVADYAARFKQTIESTSHWELTVVTLDGISGNSPGDLRKIRAAVEDCRKRFPDAALAHAEVGCHQHAVFYSLIFLRRLMPQLPYCVTVHDPPLIVAPALFPLALGSARQAVRRALRLLDYTPLGKAVLRRPLRQAAHLFALTRVGAESLSRVVGGDVPVDYLPMVSPNAVFSNRARPVASDRPVKILYLGFWGPRTGIPQLLHGFERLVEASTRSVKLLLAGGADHSEASREFTRSVAATIEASPARDSIELVGFVPESGMDSLFREADVFVLPYTSAPAFSASGVLLRAAAAGLAIVATDLDMVREHIADERSGLIVPAGRVDALAAALDRLVRDPDLRYRLGRAAQTHLQRRHGARDIASTVLPVYERIGRPGLELSAVSVG